MTPGVPLATWFLLAVGHVQGHQVVVVGSGHQRCCFLYLPCNESDSYPPRVKAHLWIRAEAINRTDFVSSKMYIRGLWSESMVNDRPYTY